MSNVMQIETYEVPEVAACDGTVESEAEAVALIERLGLEGQRELLNPTKKQERCPYRKMTAEEFKVYEVILSNKTPLKKFSDGPIPLRVLQVAAHAQELFDHVYVWHAPNADIKDPLLVGINGACADYGDRQYFLLARWGDVLLPFAELRALAAKLWAEKLRVKFSKIMAEAKARLESVNEADCLLMDAPNVYWKD